MLLNWIIIINLIYYIFQIKNLKLLILIEILIINSVLYKSGYHLDLNLIIIFIIGACETIIGLNLIIKYGN